MAAWVAVRASRVLHKQWDSNFGLVVWPDRVNPWRIDETEVSERINQHHWPKTILLLATYWDLFEIRKKQEYLFPIPQIELVS